MNLKGSEKMKIGTLDVYNSGKVALYVGLSAAIVSVIQAISGADFSSIVLTVAGLKVEGTHIAMLVVNVLVFLGKKLATDTTGE